VTRSPPVTWSLPIERKKLLPAIHFNPHVQNVQLPKASCSVDAGNIMTKQKQNESSVVRCYL
jgi:hypothetical protein